MPSTQSLSSKPKSSQFSALTVAMSDDDDDFQDPISLTQKPRLSFLRKPIKSHNSQPLKPSNGTPSKKQKRIVGIGKENTRIPKKDYELGSIKLTASDSSLEFEDVACSQFDTVKVCQLEVGSSLNLFNSRIDESFKNAHEGGDLCENDERNGLELDGDRVFPSMGLHSPEPFTNCSFRVDSTCLSENVQSDCDEKVEFKAKTCHLSNSIEHRLSESSINVCCTVRDSLFDGNVYDVGVLCENDERNELESNESNVFSSIDLHSPESVMNYKSKADSTSLREQLPSQCNQNIGFKAKTGYLSNSIESRLLATRINNKLTYTDDEESFLDFEAGTQLGDLIKLCSEPGDEDNINGADFPEGNGLLDGLVECPLCGADISNLNQELRQVHTNDCLDKNEIQKIDSSKDETKSRSPQQVVDVSPVLEWLRNLGLSRYEEAFIKEEVDWNTLQLLTEEDLFSIGVTTLGPRKKIMHALDELRKGNPHADQGNASTYKVTSDETRKLPGNKLITEFFPGSSGATRNRELPRSSEEHRVERSDRGSTCKRGTSRNSGRKGKTKEVPSWCCISGTPFRVDAFRYSRGDCSHWFLTHFHIDHYQGLTRNFNHGKIYCSSITAQLVNMKIGIPWDKLQVLPLNQKINIAGINLLCLDANHCPGAIIILFEPPNKKPILHTGDFRFHEEMKKIPSLQSCPIETLILDTTYCNPQYDFPKQEEVIQFVIEAIQAEDFNPKTLFLIGSYTIGKERLFIEVARCLQKKVYVGAVKLHTLKCLEISEEDMKWFTSNERESNIHVVPLWTIASFKRMKYLSNQYLGRFNSIVAFSPTGWSFGKGKKKAQGRRCQQGTIIRYEVPYSEHSSFTELKEFVRFISPEKIIPSVNNDGPESVNAMIELLKS